MKETQPLLESPREDASPSFLRAPLRSEEATAYVSRRSNPQHSLAHHHRAVTRDGIYGTAPPTAPPLAAGDMGWNGSDGGDAAATPPSTAAATPHSERGFGVDNLLLSILCLLLFIPTSAQFFQCCKRRKRNRVERELERVSTNPTSRMLVLSEIFKNDSRPVTEDDASPKKKKVLVKKHRKKTLLERGRKSKSSSDADEADRVGEGPDEEGSYEDDEDEETGDRHHGLCDWTSEEEEEGTAAAMRDGTPRIVYVSSFDHLENHTVRGVHEDAPHFAEQGDGEEGELVTSTSPQKSTWRGHDVSGYTDHQDVQAGNVPSRGQAQVSTAGRKDGDSKNHAACEKTQEDAGDAQKGQPKDSQLEVLEGRHRADGHSRAVEKNNNDDASVVDDPTDNVRSKENSIDVISLESEEKANVASGGDNCDTPRMSGSGAPEQKPDDHRDGSIDTNQNNAADGTTRSVLLSPKLPSMPSLANKDFSEDITASSNQSPRDATASPGETAPSIPPLSMVSLSTLRTCLSPRASPDDLEAGGLRSAPALTLSGLSDEECDDDGAVVDKVPIFLERTGHSGHDNAQASIQGCGSSVTEVTSNVDGLLLKGGGSTSSEDVKLEPLETSTLKGMEAADAIPSGRHPPYPSTHEEATLFCSTPSYPLERMISRTSTLSADIYPPYQLDRVLSGISTTSSAPGVSMPMRTGESYMSAASSTVSYFTHDDVTIASEELETCAICLCPYDEGEIRMFSKRCPHAFHKACILEWLVKSHNECPCCRTSMVTKSEIKETSASLIGTKRLAQAMLAAELEEAPPFRGVRRPPQLARQMLTRARAQRQRWRSGQGSHQVDPLMMNRDWLWATRFDDSQSITATEQPSILPSRSADLISNRRETNQNDSTARHAPPEAAPAPAAHGEASMHDTTTGSLYSSTLHNHWQQRQRAHTNPRSTQPTLLRPQLRFHSHWRPLDANNAEGQLPVTIIERPAIFPSRSADAIMNPHETNQNISTAHRAPPEAAPDAHGQVPMHSTTAGSLFSPTLHNHWQRRQNPHTNTSNTQPIVLRSPSRLHSHWRQSGPHANNADEELPVTVLPAI